MQERSFQVGDLVRHLARPEWGAGNVLRIERATVHGVPSQRLTVRFPSHGTKTLAIPPAPIEAATPQDKEDLHMIPNGQTFREREANHEGGWLGSISKCKPEDILIELPEPATDPFSSLKSRLQATLGLYRFGRTAGGLIEWAVAQTGLDDPLGRFNRHELEQYFDNWAVKRDQHLRKLLAEARFEHGLVDSLLPAAPPAARNMVKQINTRR